MKRLNMIVEGVTEEAFVRDVLGPHLAGRQIYVSARRVETGRRRGKIYRGGMTSYARVRNDIARWLKEDPSAFLTTQFDLYALPDDFPGFVEARGMRQPHDRVVRLEKEFAQDIQSERFIPYLQLHEFEGLLFSDVIAVDEVMQSTSPKGQREELQRIRAAYQSPEHIDDGPDSAPSKRLLALYPGYDKPAFGSRIAQRIGLSCLRRECRHFGDWLDRLESL